MVLHELEGFSYATALDLKLGCHTLRLDQDASKICTIILPWGKYTPTWVNNGYGRFSRHILEKKVELIESQEDVGAHLDDLLCISWGSLEDQLDNLDGFSSNFATLTQRSMWKKWHSLHLKLNTWRHLHTSNSNKAQSNKFQGIIAI